MTRKSLSFYSGVALLALASAGAPASYATPVYVPADTAEQNAAPLNWKSPARLHHSFKSTPGSLIFTASGIEFRSESRFSHRWAFGEVKTFELTAREFVLADYENRQHHLPGIRHFRFDLKERIPPAVAAELASMVGKPVVDADPDGGAQAFFEIPARHGTPLSGTNGTLRFRDQGIDYLSASAEGSRSWRWADIETLANPDRYHLRVCGYRETFDFELKQPLPGEIFERLWDHLYTRDLNIAAPREGEHHAK